MRPIDQKAPFGYGLADLHIHSRLGDGIPEVEAILEYVQMRTSLDVIAITDHDSLRAAYLAQELTARNQYTFEVVLGMEVSTNAGHLLALFLNTPVPANEPLLSTIEAVHSQNGLCVVSHPMSRQRDSIDRRTIEKLLVNQDKNLHLDGLEIPNARVARMICVDDVITLNRQDYHLAEVGSSDAHDLSVIGTRYTIFPGEGAASLKASILNRTTTAWDGHLPADL